MGRANRLPLLVILAAMTGLGMLVPGLHALMSGDVQLAWIFGSSAGLVLAGVLILGIATMAPPPGGSQSRDDAMAQLRAFVLAYLLLPPLMALPLLRALPDLSPVQGWFEAASSMTMTGATLLAPQEIAPSLHLWRAICGWGGGFLVLVAASAILAPLNLGGFELHAPRQFGTHSHTRGLARTDSRQRLARQALAFAPWYVAVTLAIWATLHALGDDPFEGLILSMAVISTSGITSTGGLSVLGSGIPGQMVMALVMAAALSRRAIPGAARRDLLAPSGLFDPELRLGLCLVLGSAGLMMLAHLIGGYHLTAWLWTVWTFVFTAISFLTTTGLVTPLWEYGLFSGQLSSVPVLLLMGLAFIGGGVATTAGGVTLLRLHAMGSLVHHEMARLTEPSVVIGGGPAARQMRGEGALVAFIVLMLITLSLGALNLVLAATGLPFEQALVLSVAAISTTGPLAEASGLGAMLHPPVTAILDGPWSGLSPLQHLLLGLGMVLGRVEIIALVALCLPVNWRK